MINRSNWLRMQDRSRFLPLDLRAVVLSFSHGDHGDRMKNTFALYRNSYGARFDHRSDWLRLVSLGIFIITFGTLALANNLVPERIPGHFGGGTAIFSGAILFVLIQKISRTRIYLDWTLNGVSFMAVGCVLYANEALDHSYSLVLFCTFLLASGLSRIWIGYTTEPQAASWILSSGSIALLAVLWIVGAQVLQISTSPSNVLAFDILFQGVSIVGFGLSLKDRSGKFA